MIERYPELAARIRRELEALEKVAARAKRAITLAREQLADRDPYLETFA